MTTPDTFGFEDFFGTAREGIKEANGSKALEYNDRVTAAKLGRELKPGDSQSNKLKFMEQERVNFAKGFFEDKPLEDVVKEAKDYKFPTGNMLVRLNKENELIANNDQLFKLRWALAFSPVLSAESIGDLRRDRNIHFRVVEGRVIIDSTDNPALAKLNYDAEKLLYAFLTRATDAEKKYTVLPYAHVDEKQKITSKTLFVLTPEKAEELKEILKQEVKNKLIKVAH